MATTFAEIDARSVCIFVEKLGAGSNRALGTGCFFMRRDLVLTAKHVLEDVVRDGRQVFIANGSGSGRLFGARPELFFAHPTLDLALVKVSQAGLHIDRPLFPAHFPLNAESGALAFGYNRGASDNDTNRWTVSPNRIDGFDVEERERSKGPIEYVLNFSAPWMTPGCSGGPVITLGGGVVAVLTQTFAEQQSSADGVALDSGRATSVYPILEHFRSPFE